MLAIEIDSRNEPLMKMDLSPMSDCNQREYAVDWTLHRGTFLILIFGQQKMINELVLKLKQDT
jgi:hypothetical protein